MITRIVIIWIFLAICSPLGFGTMINDPADSPTLPWESVKEFLTSDGRFDLEAARRSGYEGTLDFSGFTMRFDSKTGEPLFLPVAQEGELTKDQEQGRGGSLLCQQGKNMDATVKSLSVYNNNLVAGGTFLQAGCTQVSRIASWDGSSWDSVGCGISSNLLEGMCALTTYGSDLIGGGDFFGVGCWPGIPANGIARWNGSSWSALGSGMSGGAPLTVVYALTVYGGNLIAGGNFTQAGGISANYIAKWNGSSWSPLGTGMSHTLMIPAVYALTVYNGNLIAGGYFTHAGGNPASNIALWNGSTWSPLGSGINSQVYALTVYGTDLIAGGTFTQAGGTSANYIARWNGSSWSSLGSGMGGGSFTHVSALTVYSGNLIAGGDFTQASGTSANYIASWNGSSWSALGSGMSGGTYTKVFALTVYNSDLIAGGDFTQAGGIPANYLARWDGTSWSRVGYICGDASGDGVIDISDVVYLINYLFVGGPAPVPLGAGDANSDGVVDVSDVVYLINYLFAGGPHPSAPVSPESGLELYKDKAPAQIGFSSPVISKDGIFIVPVIGKFDVDLAGVQLEIKYDPEKITLLEPALTSKTEGLSIYSSSNGSRNLQIALTQAKACGYKSIQKIDSLRSLQVGILDPTGKHQISAGTNALVNLRMKGSDLSSRFASLTTSLEITKAILVDRGAQKIPVQIVAKMKESEEEFGGEKSAIPQEFSLSQNYPNPFNPETEISYALPRDCYVKLAIYNIAGRKVNTLVDECQSAGYKTIHWNGRDDQGKKIASGIYFYKLQAGDFCQSKKMMLIK
jgi:hypothetical protein